MLNGSMKDSFTKIKLNVFFVVENSSLIKKEDRVKINSFINEINSKLKEDNNVNSFVDFYLTLISYNDDINFYNNTKSVYVNDFKFNKLNFSGKSNINLALNKLNVLLQKESKGGVMSDFYDLPPVIYYVNNGNTSSAYKKDLKALLENKYYKHTIKYGLALNNTKKCTTLMKDLECDQIFYLDDLLKLAFKSICFDLLNNITQRTRSIPAPKSIEEDDILKPVLDIEW